MEAQETLLAMGFPQKRVVAALLQTRNDIDNALDLLSNEEFASDDPDERLARALQLQMLDEEAAQRAQREADDEELAMAMAQQMRFDERNQRMPEPPPESTYSAWHPSPLPAIPSDGLTKKQRSNRRKALNDRAKRDELREVSRAQEHRGAQL
jgi:hypothetical protein